MEGLMDCLRRSRDSHEGATKPSRRCAPPAFLLVRLRMQASTRPNKKAFFSRSEKKAFVPETGLPSAIQRLSRGGDKAPCIPLKRSAAFCISRLTRASSHRREMQKAPSTLLKGPLCPRLDSNQHAVSSATTSR